MKAIVNTNLNERTQLPSVNTPTHKYYKPGDEVNIVEIVNGDPYEGNKVWYKLDNGKYIWSGGVEGIENITSGLGEIPFSPGDYYWIHDYNIPELWAKGLTGKGVKVAILDTGISLPHKDLNIEKKNCINVSSEESGNIKDLDGHGTHCAGIIKASNNGFGVTGVAYDCDLYFGKITSDKFGDSFTRLEKGLEWAIRKKVDLVSISFGRHIDKINIQTIFQKVVKNNIIPVCAGGNMIDSVTEEDDILYPAKYDECISVGAIGRDKKPTLGTLISSALNIGAPGTEIKSTTLNNGYEVRSGTSQAAPYVCGVIALVLQYCKENGKDYSFKIVKEWLNQYSDNIEGTPFPIINPLLLFNNLN